MSVIDHPSHYAEAPHGIPGECITYTEHLGFVRGNAFKYAWRAGFKADAAEDLGKASWYVTRDITHGENNLTPKPGHLTHALTDGPITLRRRILLNLWGKHDLTRTLDLLDIALNDPDTLDEVI